MSDVQSGDELVDDSVRCHRRALLKSLAALGVGSVVFQRAMAALADEGRTVTAEMIKQAEWIAGLELNDEQREATARSVDSVLDKFRQLRAVDVGYDVPPALFFQPAGAAQATQPAAGEARLSRTAAGARPASDEDLAFLPVAELAPLIRERLVSSQELTELYLARLKEFDETLHCVVSLTEDVARRQAERADRELAAGHYRGPLHGIPWGAKDLIAYPGYKTTWGAPPFQQQVLDEKATVARRLDEAGAVLVAKLSLGALAQGDQWFGGMTRNPWNPAEGSSGSSAGSAAAVSAGLVGFALGSETLGSIVSPCRRCGAIGLRPTFGRVSRHGCMTLAWSMDKIGPITRGIEDCALVLAAIQGYDGLDATVVDRPLAWPMSGDVRHLKVGFFEDDTPADVLEVLRDVGVQLVPISLPDRYPIHAITLVLNVEAATVFDPLTRSGNTEGLNSWPNAFRQGEFVPAVEYLRANRVRTLLMRDMNRLMEQVDAYVGGSDLALTNLTGHPTVVLPFGMTERHEKPVPDAITFTGRLFGETELLALAAEFQRIGGFAWPRPENAA